MSSEQGKKLVFSAIDNGVFTMMEKVKKKSEDVYQTMLSNAEKLNSQSKDQVEWIKKTIQELEKQNKVLLESRKFIVDQQYQKAIEETFDNQDRQLVSKKFSPIKSELKSDQFKNEQTIRFLYELLEQTRSEKKEEDNSKEQRSLNKKIEEFESKNKNLLSYKSFNVKKQKTSSEIEDEEELKLNPESFLETSRIKKEAIESLVSIGVKRQDAERKVIELIKQQSQTEQVSIEKLINSVLLSKDIEIPTFVGEKKEESNKTQEDQLSPLESIYHKKGLDDIKLKFKSIEEKQEYENAIIKIEEDKKKANEFLINKSKNKELFKEEVKEEQPEQKQEEVVEERKIEKKEITPEKRNIVKKESISGLKSLGYDQNTSYERVNELINSSDDSDVVTTENIINAVLQGKKKLDEEKKSFKKEEIVDSKTNKKPQEKTNEPKFISNLERFKAEHNLSNKSQLEIDESISNKKDNENVVELGEKQKEILKSFVPNEPVKEKSELEKKEKEFTPIVETEKEKHVVKNIVPVLKEKETTKEPERYIIPGEEDAIDITGTKPEIIPKIIEQKEEVKSPVLESKILKPIVHERKEEKEIEKEKPKNIVEVKDVLKDVDKDKEVGDVIVEKIKQPVISTLKEEKEEDFKEQIVTDKKEESVVKNIVQNIIPAVKKEEKEIKKEEKQEKEPSLVEVKETPKVEQEKIYDISEDKKSETKTDTFITDKKVKDNKDEKERVENKPKNKVESLLNQIKESDEDVYEETVVGARKFSDSGRQQQSFIKDKIKSLKKENEGKEEEKEVINKFYNKESAELFSQEIQGKITPKQRDERLEELKTKTKDQISDVDETKEHNEKIIELLVELIEAVKTTATNEIVEDKKNVEKEVVEEKRTIEKEGITSVSDERGLVRAQERDILKPKEQKEEKPEHQSLFKNVLAANLISQGLSGFVGFGKERALGLAEAQSGDTFLSDSVSQINPFGIPVGAFLGGGFKRHQQEEFEVQEKEHKLKGLVGEEIHPAENVNLGFSSKETIPMMIDIAKASGGANNLVGKTQESMHVERQFSLDRGLIMQMFKDARMASSKMSVIENVAQVVNMIPELKDDKTKLSEFIQLQSELVRQNSGIVEKINRGTTTDIISRFAGIDSRFFKNAETLKPIIEGADQSLKHPSNEFAQARSFDVLSRINPGADYFDLIEMQSKGIQQQDFLQKTLESLSNQFGSGKQLMTALTGKEFGGAGVMNFAPEVSKAIIQAFEKNPEMFSGFGGSEKEALKLTGVTSVEKIKEGAYENVAQREVQIEKINQAFLESAGSGMKQVMRESGKVLIDQIKSSNLKLFEDTPIQIDISEKVANAIKSLIPSDAYHIKHH